MNGARIAPTETGDAPVRDLVRVSARVSREVAGSGGVPKEVARKVLGLSWFVYVALLRLRNPTTGLVTTTGNLLARELKSVEKATKKKKATARTMRKHLRKLASFGLVEVVERGVTDTGRVVVKRRQYFERVPGLTAWKLVVDRRVYGAMGLGASELLSVPYPAELAMLAKAATPRKTGSGGARPKAGRPAGMKSGKGRSRHARFSPKGRMGMSPEKLLAETEKAFPGSTSTLAGIQKTGLLNSKQATSIEGISLSLSNLLYPPLVASLSKEREGCAAKASQAFAPSGRDETESIPPVSHVRPASSPDDLAAFGLLAPRGFRSDLVHPLVPPAFYTSTHRTTCLQVPNPPVLDPRETPERHAYLLMCWYEGACRARFGKSPGLFKRYRNGPTASPHFALLVEAAKAFVAEDIAPAAWCAFSCQAWEHVSTKKGALPPMKFMFSAKRIEERAGWFRSEAANFSGGRILITPLMRAFAARQTSMRQFPASITTPAQLAAHVARFFPNDSYNRILDAIREENAALKEELASLVSLGRWLW